MAEERLRIERGELFSREVDAALARERAMRGRPIPEPRDVGPVRRLLLSSLFYLPVAGCLGAFAAWLIFEPIYEDTPHVAGEVALVNTDPFATPGAMSLTVAGEEVVIFPSELKLEEGEDGQPAYSSPDQIAVGDPIEVVALEPLDVHRLQAIGIRPTTRERAAEIGAVSTTSDAWLDYVVFPLTAAFITILLLIAEGISSRNWLRMIERAMLGTLLATLFSLIAVIPANILMTITLLLASGGFNEGFTVHEWTGPAFIAFTIGRSLAWCCVGAGLGLGMNLARSTRAQLRNSVLGGTLGGALGGLFFDPIARFFQSESIFEAGDVSRMVGFVAVGLCIGVFVALTERLAREAWIMVRSGPLAGKSFILYKTPTELGSAPSADIYLFKDADIDASHAVIHRVGNTFEIEDLDTRTGTTVAGAPVRRRRLSSGDQIVLGATILEFEERSKRSATAAE